MHNVNYNLEQYGEVDHVHVETVMRFLYTLHSLKIIDVHIRDYADYLYSSHTDVNMFDHFHLYYYHFHASGYILANQINAYNFFTKSL